jgi:hypothetical protein
MFFLTNLFFLLGQDDFEIKKILANSDRIFNITLENEARDYLLASYLSLNKDDRMTISRISPDVVTKRMGNYFSKKISGQGSKNLKKKDLIDFRWSYIAQDITLIEVKIETNDMDTLEEVYTGNLKINYNSTKMPVSRAIVVPLQGNSFSILGKTSSEKDMKLTATFEDASGELKGHFIFTSYYTPVCVVKIRTNPDGAEVFFNGHKYHKQTNINSSRDPGRLKVTLKKKGFRIWEEEKYMSIGEIWDIKVDLKKENPIQ